MEELVKSRGLQIPVNGEDALPVARDDPGHVGHGHGAAGAALIRVEGYDLAVTRVAHGEPPESAGSARLSRGLSIAGPLGGWAGASFRYLFSMIIVISGRSWIKSWSVGIPSAAIRQRLGTLSSFWPRCWRSLSRRSRSIALVPASWLFQGIRTLTQGSLS